MKRALWITSGILLTIFINFVSISAAEKGERIGLLGTFRRWKADVA